MAFHVLKMFAKTSDLLISPETGSLPPSMGTIARFRSGKGGNLGEVITTLSEELTERGIEFHLATPNQGFRCTHRGFPDTAAITCELFQKTGKQ
jgi:hypothetical protein